MNCAACQEKKKKQLKFRLIAFGYVKHTIFRYLVVQFLEMNKTTGLSKLRNFKFFGKIYFAATDYLTYVTVTLETEKAAVLSPSLII